MIENAKELNFSDVKNEEDVDKILMEKTGTGIATCKEALFKSVSTRANEIVSGVANIAPYGNYDTLLEDEGKMSEFVQTEAAKIENWHLEFVSAKEQDKVIELMFFNKAVDEGDVMKGFVYLGFSGKVRHSFAQIR